MILWQNTTRFFGLDPFEHIAEEDATVGAPRALSPGVDTEFRSKHEWRRLHDLRPKTAR